MRGRVVATAPARAARSNEGSAAALPRGEVAGVEGLQRVLGDHVVPGAGAGPVDGVQQLTQRHGRGSRLAAVLVGAGVGDHQGLPRRDHRVEQQLAVLAARVALAGERVAGQHVVAVGDGAAREDAVVETDQADHPVRHRPHRHQRGDGQVAGAEVGPGGSRLGALLQQRADVGQPQLGGPPGRGVTHAVDLALELRHLPLLRHRRRGQVEDAVPELGQPRLQGGGAAQRVDADARAGRPAPPAGPRDRPGRCRRRRAAAPRPGCGRRSRPSPPRAGCGRGPRARCSGRSRRAGTPPAAPRSAPTGRRTAPTHAVRVATSSSESRNR